MGTLILIATPIGNLDDLTHRAQRMLAEVDALACEDTRQTRKLLDRYGIPKPKNLFAHHEHNEERSAKGILKLLDEGQTVGLVSDGGYPGISDPGYRIVSLAIEAGHTVDVLPGASAIPVALLLSGLPTSSYTFKGFPPRKTGQRRRFFAQEAELPHTLICFEAPNRIADTLADALEALGDRRAAVCLELTKLHQRVHRGYLADLQPLFTEEAPKGEATIVIAGNNRKFVRQ